MCTAALLLPSLSQLYDELDEIQAQLGNSDLDEFERETLELRLHEIEDQLSGLGHNQRATGSDEDERKASPSVPSPLPIARFGSFQSFFIRNCQATHVAALHRSTRFIAAPARSLPEEEARCPVPADFGGDPREGRNADWCR